MILFCILMIAVPLKAERPTIVDTIYTENSLQGGISFFPGAGAYLYGIFNPQQDFLVGDWYDQWYLNEPVSTRAYLSFSIQPVPTNHQIDSVFIMINQYQCYNNDSPGVFPIWNVPPYIFPCNLYHVDYGMTLEPADFEPEIFSLVGGITSDSVNGWKKLNITSAYLQDLNQSRPYYQVMLKFDVLTDYDYSIDGVYFFTSYSYYPEHLIIYYSSTIATSDEITPSLNFINIYPNPSRGQFSISISKGSILQSVEMYNLKGQRVFTDNKLKMEKNNYQVDISPLKLAPGVYILKSILTSNSRKYTACQKVIVIQ